MRVQDKRHGDHLDEELLSVLAAKEQRPRSRKDRADAGAMTDSDRLEAQLSGMSVKPTYTTEDLDLSQWKVA